MIGSAPVLCVGAVGLADGGSAEITEADHLRFRVEGLADRPVLRLSRDDVPLVADGPQRWAADPAWVGDTATSHLVGECPVELITADGRTLHRSLLVRRPSRITEAQYAWLVAALARRAGLAAVEDPFGRARVWYELAPDVPSPGEERARLALELWSRAAAALRSLAFSPVPVLRPDPMWIPVERLRSLPSRAISARHLRPWDPPRPSGRPTSGVVLVDRVEETADTTENRFVAATAAALANLLARCGADSEIPAGLAQACRSAAAELSGWFRDDPWRRLPPGPFPAQSFLIRDHPQYQTVARLHRLLADLPGALLAFPPTEEAFRLSPQSLNLLYQRWTGVVAAEWLEGRLGVGPARPPVPARGAYRWSQAGWSVTLRIDERYPRTGRTGVICPTGKNAPDVAVELAREGRAIEVAVLDATYSRRACLHEEKLGYGLTLVDAGWRSALTGRPARCVRWAAVAYPGPDLDILERRAALAESILSLPPGDAAEALLRRWLDATVGQSLPG